MSRNLAFLMLAGSALFWSGNFVLGRAFATDIAPVTLSYLRWCVALICFIPFSWRALLAQWPLIRQHGWKLVFMGTLGVAGFNTLAYLGLHSTSATNALLINSFIPILIILFSRIYPGVAISPLRLIGIVISTAGVLLLVSRGELAKLLAFEFNVGDLWILGAAMIWAIYSISLRWRPAGITAPVFLTVTMIVGVLVLSPIFWLNLNHEPAFEATPENLLAVAYVAWFASIGAFLFWNQGVKIVGAGTAGQFIHLMPVFGTTMAVVFLNEQLYWFHFAGAAAIGLGILLSLRSK